MSDDEGFGRFTDEMAERQVAQLQDNWEEWVGHVRSDIDIAEAAIANRDWEVAQDKATDLSRSMLVLGVVTTSLLEHERDKSIRERTERYTAIDAEEIEVTVPDTVPTEWTENREEG